MSIAAANMMEKYELIQDESLMEAWLDKTHSDEHMPWREYLLFWAQAKEEFLTKVFNNQLIHKFDINFSKSHEEMLREMDNNYNFANNKAKCENSVRHVFHNLLERRYGICHSHAESIVEKFLWGRIDRAIDLFERFLGEKMPNKELEFFISMSNLVKLMSSNILFNCDSLIKNHCGFSVTFRIPEASKPFQIVDDQKPFKVLVSFAKYMKPYVDEKVIDELLTNIEAFRIVHSQILNTKNTHGKLCLSIHPMDYMTMSDNGCDWHSCMRWEKSFGEYHAGTLEMMTSPSVVVAYLESKESWFPVAGEKAWSNKKWRELFIVTPDFITGIKGYPYPSETLEEIVFEKLAMLMKQNCSITFNVNNIQRQQGYCLAPTGARIIFKTTIMYNDCSWNDISTIFAENCNIIEDLDFFYGEGAYCIKCGKIREDCEDIEGYEDTLCCASCSGRVICSYCGEIIRNVLFYYDPNGEIICDDCYQGLCSDDLIKERWGFENDFSDIHIHVVNRNGLNTTEILTIRNDTLDDLADSGATSQILKYWNSIDVLSKPIPDNSEYQYLKDALAAWAKSNKFTIQYEEASADSTSLTLNSSR